MRLIFRLMQSDGVVGPTRSVNLDNPDPHPQAINRMASNWANGQTGHPWDALMVEFPDGEREPYDLYTKEAI